MPTFPNSYFCILYSIECDLIREREKLSHARTHAELSIFVSMHNGNAWVNCVTLILWMLECLRHCETLTWKTN